MSRILGRLLVWVTDALERSLILVPDIDEVDGMRRGPYFTDRMDTGARRCSRCSPHT
jgi:hypothetical protein